MTLVLVIDYLVGPEQMLVTSTIRAEFGYNHLPSPSITFHSSVSGLSGLCSRPSVFGSLAPMSVSEGCLETKDTANLAQLLVHLKACKNAVSEHQNFTEHQNIRTSEQVQFLQQSDWEHPRRNDVVKTDLKVTQALFTSISMAPLPTSNTLLVSLKMSS